METKASGIRTHRWMHDWLWVCSHAIKPCSKHTHAHARTHTSSWGGGVGGAWDGLLLFGQLHSFPAILFIVHKQQTLDRQPSPSCRQLRGTLTWRRFKRARANVPMSDVTPNPPSPLPSPPTTTTHPSLHRQRGGERRRAPGELLAESGALQQADPAGCEQEPAGGHLHPGVSVSAHQCRTYPSSHTCKRPSSPLPAHCCFAVKRLFFSKHLILFPSFHDCVGILKLTFCRAVKPLSVEH